MLLDWFNAREAVEIGSSLADQLLPNASAAQGDRPVRSGNALPDLQKSLQRAAGEARSLKLNLFKRAKLLGSFKWRLQERGLDPRRADELTHLLLLQLTGGRAAAAGGARGAASGASKKRLAPLLTEADACFAKGDYTDAMARLREALEIDPKHAFAHNKLGAVFCQLGSYADAEREFRRAIELRSNYAHPHFNLGVVLFWKGEFAAAEAVQRRAVRLDAKNPEAQVSLGMTLGTVGRVNEARGAFEKAIRLQPGHAGALCGSGWLAALEGRSAEAESLYRKALASDPKKIDAWTALADLRRMTPDDEDWRQAVEKMLKAGAAPLEEASLHYALGKYFDDVGKYSEAFSHYRRANELQKLVAKPYERPRREAFVDDMIRTYTRERLAQRRAGASGSVQPVFVVGMMRSGTSLVEQIIASHPRAAGAGELEFWSRSGRSYEDVLRHGLPDAALTAKLADEYLKTLHRHLPQAERIVDKSTFNSDYLGVIHAVLPNARVLYLRRDPLDTCLSCYFQHFVNAAPFSMDLADLAHYYREHHRLVTHWREVLPRETFLEVPYAELVRDQEGWSRKIIEFIGLDWDPRVLEFHKTERAVLTASNWQVRQKMYSSSVGRWHHYEKLIGPLLKLRDLSP